MNKDDAFVASLHELRAKRRKNSERIAALQKSITGQCRSISEQLSLMSLLINKIKEFIH